MRFGKCSVNLIYRETTEEPSFPPDPVEEALGDLVLAQERHEPWAPEDYRKQVGERWEEFLGCLRLLGMLEPAASLLGNQEPVEDEVLPDTVAGFPIVRMLGSGGSGLVYLARDPELDGLVALKCLHPGESSVGTNAREALALMQVAHPAVPKIHGILEDGGRQVLAMEYLPGPNLEAAIDSLRTAPGSVPPDDLVRDSDRLRTIESRVTCILQIARALEACHDCGVLHRDIKPSNILLAHGHAPHLIDFGLAHRSWSGSEDPTSRQFVGSLPYLAPEQAATEQVGASAASDQFALGVVLYELLALGNPFRRPTRAATLEALLRADPSPPSTIEIEIPPELDWICRKSMQKCPEDRYASVRELADDLEAFLDHRPLQASGPGLPSMVRRILRRREFQWCAIILALLGLGIGIASFEARQFASALSDWEQRIESANATLAALDTPGELMDLWSKTMREADQLRSRRAPVLAQSGPVNWLAPLSVFQKAWAARVQQCVLAATETALATTFLADQRRGLASVHQDWFRAWNTIEQVESYGTDVSPLCRVWLPKDARLFQVAATYFPPLTPVKDPLRLPVGEYRVIMQETGQEQDLIIWPLQLTARIQARDLSNAADREFTTVIPTEVEVRSAIEAGYETPRPFLIAAQDLRKEDFEEVLSSAQMLPLLRYHEVERRSEDDLVIPWAHAAQTARMHGCRLPSVGELWIAYRRGLLAEGRQKYWSSMPIPGTGKRALVLTAPPLGGLQGLESQVHAVPADAYHPDVHVRLVKTDAP